MRGKIQRKIFGCIACNRICTFNFIGTLIVRAVFTGMVYRREIAHAVYRVNRAVAGAIAAIPMRAGYQYLLISPRFYFGIAQPDSYAFQTIDYLLKPITLKRFLSATQKIEAAFGKQPVAESKPDEGYFFVKTGKTLRKILLDEVLYFEGEKEYVRMVTGAEVLLIYRRLKDIEEQLSSPFVRVITLISSTPNCAVKYRITIFTLAINRSRLVKSLEMVL